MPSISNASVLTELEGAILSEIAHRGNTTAFRVRRAFELSPSIEWSGSAGAIYPAIRRLRERGLLAGEATGDRRATVRLSLTDEGEAAMLAWACDPERASSVGLDPFRLRVGIWTRLSGDQRASAIINTADAIRRNIAYLETYLPTLDEVEAARVELSLAVQKLRLHHLEQPWLAALL
jgi:DNA-binding PadR family transcriptional regulator